MKYGFIYFPLWNDIRLFVCMSEEKKGKKTQTQMDYHYPLPSIQLFYQVDFNICL